MIKVTRVSPGLFIVTSITAMAYGLAQLEVMKHYGLSPLVLAIALGTLLGNALPQAGQGSFRCGLALAQRQFLRTGVALYGFNLSMQQIIQVGSTGILVDVLMVASTLLVGWYIGHHVLKMDRDTVLLASAGSAICGAAAVVATVPMLRIDEKTVADKSAVAVATVIVFGTLAMFIYPMIYGWIGATHFDFGIYVGSTVHEVAQVVAIGSAIGDDVARHAVIVKMIRVMLLVPFLLFVGTFVTGKSEEGQSNAIPVPWFAICFIAIAGLNSLAILPETVVSMLRLVGMLLLTTAMAALGIDTNLPRMKHAGIRPLLLGTALFLHLILVGGLFNWLVG